MRPAIIGITAAIDEDDERFCLTRHYVNAVTQAGGLPFILPSLSINLAAAILERVQGLILSGGGDLDPSYFGEEPLPATKKIAPRRDAFEIAVARAALVRKIPVLGICRGLQVLNVAAGGKVFQDISLGVYNPLKHFQDAPRWHATHHIEILPGSKLASIFGTLRLRVNSFHHQAVRRLAPVFKATAWASDGVIEAIEAEVHPFAVGVQFHPEGMWENEPVFLKLFSALIASCVHSSEPSVSGKSFPP
ncbi:MAG: gamma-glutamyl-gamma-aminobutyrate hydrolase family protein [Bacillota bacterium]